MEIVRVCVCARGRSVAGQVDFHRVLMHTHTHTREVKEGHFMLNVLD